MGRCSLEYDCHGNLDKKLRMRTAARLTGEEIGAKHRTQTHNSDKDWQLKGEYQPTEIYDVRGSKTLMSFINKKNRSTINSRAAF